MTNASRAVLVVEDEPQLRRVLRTLLELANFRVVEADSAERGLLEARTHKPDLLIVDLGLPDRDGIEVITGVRSWSPVPIIVLSARSAESDKVAALEAGADDYITKPFGARELVARLNAALRRAARGEEEPRIVVDGLEIDLAARVVRRDGEPVHLTPIEFDLLRVLVRNRGRLMTHRKLLAEVWGAEYVDDIQPLRTHIARLRAKIEPDDDAGAGGVGGPRLIVTDPGVGYRFSE
jgi:two-component system KDP operon response regulator KdpE